jgi:hypothetical protein
MTEQTEQTTQEENRFKVGKVSYVAKGGGHGVKLEGDDFTWYNPEPAIKDSVTEEKYKGKVVEIRLLEAGSKKFDAITILDDLKSADQHKVEEETIQEEPVKEEKVPQAPPKEEKVAEPEPKSQIETKEEGPQPDPAVEEEDEDMPEVPDNMPELIKSTMLRAFNPMTEAEVGKLMGTELETAKKGPHKLTYASWAEAWGQLKKIYPNAQYKVYENRQGMPYFADNTGAFVKVGVTIKGLEHVCHLPVMDHMNKSIPKDKLDTFAINKNIQRALAKAIALHGLGLYVFKGEDYPEEAQQ